jgi:hypothetical protein
MLHNFHNIKGERSKIRLPLFRAPRDDGVWGSEGKYPRFLKFVIRWDVHHIYDHVPLLLARD